MYNDGKNVCQINQCTACNTCVLLCPTEAISIITSIDKTNAIIDTDKCINCGLCRNSCQINCPPVKKTPIYWKQGWAQEDIRKKSSSGGFATAIAQSFIKSGGVVYSACFENGEFIFKSASDIEETAKFAGSKYVKIFPNNIYSEIKNKLLSSEKVLFIGLPCHIGGLLKYLKKNYDNLYTIDLICHGTPSPKILDIFVEQYGKSISKAKNVNFRNNGKFQISIDGQTLITPKVNDKYMISFLNGFTYTENCYSCQYASFERITDLTLGDSWGSKSKNELNIGLSLALCQSKKGIEMLNNADLHLDDVNIFEAVASNSQLQRPSMKPKNRYAFFSDINKGNLFNRVVFYHMPKQCLRQNIKELLLNCKLQ